MKDVPGWSDVKLRDFATVAFQCEEMAANHFMSTPLSGTRLEGLKPGQLARGHAWHRQELANILNRVAVNYFNSEESEAKVAKFWKKYDIAC